MGTEVALPLSLQELAGFLQVTEGILGPSHRCMVQRWGNGGAWKTQDSLASHRVKPRPLSSLVQVQGLLPASVLSPGKEGRGLPLLTLPEVVTIDYLFLNI